MKNQKKEINSQNHLLDKLRMKQDQSQQEKSLNRKDHQEVQQEKNDDNNKFEEKKQKLQDETQGFMYQQSSKFSSLSRNLVFGIIGTIWFLIYVDGKLKITNLFLLVSLLSGLVFLFCDVIHYYKDSRSYQDELHRLDGYRTEQDLIDKHEPNMDKINKQSHQFINIKFYLLVLTVVFFALGFISILIKETFGIDIYDLYNSLKIKILLFFIKLVSVIKFYLL